MAHGASTTDLCPLDGCGGTIEGYWSEHERDDGTWCPFGPEHPDWDAWDEERTLCIECGEGDLPGNPLDYCGDSGIYSHPGCLHDGEPEESDPPD
jgi:hypothetical protein